MTLVTLDTRLPAPERSSETPRRWHPQLPRSRRIAAAVLAVATVAIVGLVTARGLFTAPIRFDDEGTYVSQANAVLHGNLAPYTYWYDHPPVGWIILAGWMATGGQLWHAANPIDTGREFMLILTVISVALIYVLGRRLKLSPVGAAAAGLLFGLSPLAVSYHRMVLLDNIATPLLLASMLLALSPGRRLSATLGSGLALSLAVLSKETVLLLAPFVLWLLWRNADRATRVMNVTIFVLALALPTSLYVLFAATKGELLPGVGHVSLVSGIIFQLAGRASSGSVLNSSSDAYSTVSGWLSLDSWLPGAAVLLSVAGLAVRRLRPVACAYVLLCVMLLRPGYLPVPYVVAMLPLAALLVAGVVDRVLHLCGDIMLGRGWPQRITKTPTAQHARPLSKSAVARVAAAVVAVATVATGFEVARAAEPDWRNRDVALETIDFDAPYQDAVSWLLQNVSRSRTLLVDNVVWTDLRAHGYQQRHLIWFTKVGVDPQLQPIVPSYRSVDYIVSSDIIRTSRSNSPIVQAALAHSDPVAAFGTGSRLIVIRKVYR